MRTYSLNIKLDDDVIEKLKVVCKEKERSMGWYINDLLKKHLNTINQVVKNPTQEKEVIIIPSKPLDNEFSEMAKKFNEKMSNIKSSKPDFPIYESVDDVVLDQELIDKINNEYKKIGGNQDNNIKLSIQATRQKIFDKQQKDLNSIKTIE
jgi:hypothetical protein